MGDGRSRSGRPRPSQIPFAAAYVTSRPVRSMSSNGPSGKPASRSASSICSTVAASCSSIRSASIVNGRLTRLTMKPGRSADRTAVRPHDSTRAVAYLGQGRRGAQPDEPTVDPVLDRVGIQVEARGTTGEPVPDAIGRVLEGRLVDVVQDDLVAGFESELGDAGPHGPRPDDADDH